MKNEQLITPNYMSNYTTHQLILPLDISMKIDENSEVVSFSEAMKGVELSSYFKNIKARGNRGYDKVAMLNIVLFAFSLGVRHLRDIESLCRNDIRFMWLSNDIQPSHMAIQRFLNDHLTNAIDDIYFDVSQQIAKLVNADVNTQYIDGSKFEANAHKNSFVYKTRIVNAREKLYRKIADGIFRLNQAYGYHYEYKKEYATIEVGSMAQYLMEVMVHNEIEIKYGKGQRKSDMQRFYDELLEYYCKLDEYEYWLYIIEDRNSCSKIDHDATMMNTKYDYYNQTGVSKPCYNVQIAVADGIIVNADIYQRPGDTKTFIPFMERYKEYTGELPHYAVTDAGYGGYENYMYILKNQLAFTQKYNYYAKKDDSKFKKKIYNPMNWKVNREGYKVCPNGNVFNEYLGDRIEDNNETYKITQLYKSKKGCENCIQKESCTKAKERTLTKNVVLEEFHQKVDETLGSELGKEMKKQRSIQAEGAFGIIKQNMKFDRFQRRGLKSARMEFLLVCLGYNFMKYHVYRLRQKEQVLYS